MCIKVTFWHNRNIDTYIIGSSRCDIEQNHCVGTTRLVERGPVNSPRADSTEPTRVSDFATAFPSARTPIPSIAVTEKGAKKCRTAPSAIKIQETDTVGDRECDVVMTPQLAGNWGDSDTVT